MTPDLEHAIDRWINEEQRWGNAAYPPAPPQAIETLRIDLATAFHFELPVACREMLARTDGMYDIGLRVFGSQQHAEDPDDPANETIMSATEHIRAELAQAPLIVFATLNDELYVFNQATDIFEARELSESAGVWKTFLDFDAMATFVLLRALD